MKMSRKFMGNRLYISKQVLPSVSNYFPFVRISRVLPRPPVKTKSAMNLDLLRDIQGWVLGFN